MVERTVGEKLETLPSPCLDAPPEAGCYSAPRAADSAPQAAERTPTQTPTQGMRIGPHLHLLRPLGQGGMGCIWLAEHLALRTRVAVKFLRDVFADDPQAAERLRREAEAAARVQSPHVLRVFDLGFTDHGVPYIVMERLEGETLQSVLDQRHRLSLQETVAIVRQIGAALSRAHEAGVVHRDIKPENVFLVAGERELFVKVLDFGIAKDIAAGAERLTMTGAIMGTPYFMSPEQMAGGAQVGPQSDLWSLGVVAYLCLTGQIPFRGATLAAVAVAIDRGPPPPPSQLVPGLPPAIDRWVLSLLQADPARRFQSARAALEALDAALEAPHEAECASPAPEATSPSEHRPSWDFLPSLVTTLLPLGSTGKARGARPRAWAAAAAVAGLSVVATWAGVSGVTWAAREAPRTEQGTELAAREDATGARPAAHAAASLASPASLPVPASPAAPVPAAVAASLAAPGSPAVLASPAAPVPAAAACAPSAASPSAASPSAASPSAASPSAASPEPAGRSSATPTAAPARASKGNTPTRVAPHARPRRDLGF